MTRAFLLEREQFVPRPPAEVFAFFCDISNLARITPPSARFRILTPLPVAMGEGTLLEFRVAPFLVPFRWTSRIGEWEPGRGFTDTQGSGPFRTWRHRHEFLPAEGGTRIADRVEYTLPLGPLGAAAGALLVQPALKRIFDYRREAVASLLGG